jgi:hypothetical protein
MPGGNCKDLETLCHILRWIHKLQDKHWRDNLDLSGSILDSDARNNYNSVTTRVCFPIKEKELDDLIKTSVEGNHHLTIGNLFLPPLDLNKDFVPVLSITSDFEAAPPNTQLWVGMFSCDKKRNLRVWGFRFETAHVNTNHDYSHSQFTRTFRRTKDGRKFQNLPEWMPEHLPCIVVPSNGPVSLVFCMLISLYGQRGYGLITKMGGD